MSLPSNHRVMPLDSSRRTYRSLRRRRTWMAWVAAALMAGPLAGHAALTSVAGGLGVYDSTNNYTWTSDANLMATQAATYGGGSAAFVSAVIAASGGVIYDTPNGYDSVANSGAYSLSAGDFNTTSGSMNWWGAQAWVHYLNTTNYGGSNQWALPTTVDSSSASGCGTSCGYVPGPSSSQLVQLFYGGLGQFSGSAIGIEHNSNYNLFSNMQNGYYWSSEDPSDPRGAYFFYNTRGSQFVNGKFNDAYALAVSPGQISAVPLPGAMWLLGSGLLGLVCVGRRKAQG